MNCEIDADSTTTTSMANTIDQSGQQEREQEPTTSSIDSFDSSCEDPQQYLLNKYLSMAYQATIDDTEHHCHGEMLETSYDDEDASWLETLQGRPLKVLAEKTEQLQKLVEEGRSGVSGEEAAATGQLHPLLVFSGPATKSFLDRCESKCHEILTHLANIDFELRLCETVAVSSN